MYKYNKFLDAALIAVIGYHLQVAPYTKVEESFNIQAIHDILNYGVFPKDAVLANYDHFEFPGSVPRTFVGNVLLAFVLKPLVYVLGLVGYDLVGVDQSQLLVAVRAVLGLANAYALTHLRNTFNKITLADKKSAVKGLNGFWFLVFLLSQFHLLYYASRTLPNFIALPLTLFALSKVLAGNLVGLTWLAFTAIIFRLEIGLLGVAIAFVSSLIFGQSKLHINFLLLAVGTIAGFFVTLFVDSYFWNEPVVPELFAFKFNVIDGQSANWGVEPFGAYFQKYLYQLFRPPVILALSIPGLLSDPADDGVTLSDQIEKGAVAHPARHSLRILYISSLLYVFGMSFQPHKEWRFIIYVVPIITLQAANSFTNISIKYSLSFLYKILFFIALANVAIGAVLSLGLGYISSFNYPGGDALQFVNDFAKQNYANQSFFVHLDTAACMTGVNRFGQLHNEYVTYDKTESELGLAKIWNNIDVLVSELGPQDMFHVDNWELIHTSTLFKGVTLPFKREDVNADGLRRLVTFVASEALAGNYSVLVSSLRTAVITDDFLYVYKRLRKDDGMEKVVARLEEEEEEKVAQQQKDIEAEAKLHEYVHEIDPESIKESINEQIDELEE